MSIRIGGYDFLGPFNDPGRLADSSGVYTVLAANADGYQLVDVGESATVQSRLRTHDRKLCWVGVARGRSLTFAVHYTPHAHAAGRRSVEQSIRSQYSVPCGDH